jgi:Transposase IS66 family
MGNEIPSASQIETRDAFRLKELEYLRKEIEYRTANQCSIERNVIVAVTAVYVALAYVRAGELSWLTPLEIYLWAPRKIGATHPTPQKCRQMIPLRSRSDSLTFTPGPYAIGIESNFSRCPYDNLLKRLCSGCLLHVDETSVSVKGVSCYVWVLASLEEVAYIYTSTREGDTIQALLKDFSGVLVSDFYAAYDAINCPQQKCLIHFIRDLNGAILKHPYDVGLKRLAGDFAGLLKPMVETVDRRGLKKRFLGKYRSSVHRFYNRLSECLVTSEAAKKLVSRLQKNRNKMFTFLDFDDVPWNNNNAEHAVKAFASVHRRVIEGPTTEKGLRDFLVLLSICETCKCKNVDFLEFLRSGTKDIDDFATNGRNNESGERNREWVVK